MPRRGRSHRIRNGSDDIPTVLTSSSPTIGRKIRAAALSGATLTALTSENTEGRQHQAAIKIETISRPTGGLDPKPRGNHRRFPVAVADAVEQAGVAQQFAGWLVVAELSDAQLRRLQFIERLERGVGGTSAASGYSNTISLLAKAACAGLLTA